MSEARLSPERALLRLQQLAKEERAAVAAGDIEALCRIAELLPATMEALSGVQATPAPERLNARTPNRAAIIQEALEAHAAAEAFLTERLKVASEQLQQHAAARRLAQTYGRRPRPGFSCLDDQR